MVFRLLGRASERIALGFHVVVASDCVASHTPVLHEATLANARFVFGDVLSRREIAAVWRTGS